MWLGLVLAFATSAAGAEPTGRDLSGRVFLEDDSPVTNATVFVYTAGPKTGSGVVCPSCYPDCNKRAKTSAHGDFTIASLDPTLLFRLLVVAPGYESQYVTKVDPARGAKTITLSRLSANKLHSPSRIAGLVLDASGKPLAGATIGPEGVSHGSSTSWGGTDRFVDPLAVTDERGQFWLFCTNGVDRVHAVVEGRAVAKRWVELTPGRDHLIRMQEGVTVTGTIRRDGQPVKGAVLGLVTKDRTCGSCLHGDELASDQNGFFLLPNVTSGREFVLYAKMDSMPADGATPAVIFTTGAAGTRHDCGILEVKPAQRVAGRIVLSDGARVPKGTRLFLGREPAWDHTEAMIDEDGRFEFRGVPEESVGLSVRVTGYKFSKRNASLDWLNGGLIGRVDGDIPDLTLLMEPGQWRYNGEEGEPPSGESQPGEKPLRGVKP
jgi:hypothetical protein